MSIQTYLLNLCKHCGIEADTLVVEVTDEPDMIVAQIDVPEEESGLLIGFHGETLSSIQRLTRVVFQDELGDRRLVVNVNNYRQQREEKLKDIARRGAQRVLETGQAYTFSYLPANERFVIHTTISEDPEFVELESVSEGEGRDRVLMIRLKAVV
jgi:spoIIIJ-associated protein